MEIYMYILIIAYFSALFLSLALLVCILNVMIVTKRKDIDIEKIRGTYKYEFMCDELNDTVGRTIVGVGLFLNLIILIFMFKGC